MTMEEAFTSLLERVEIAYQRIMTIHRDPSFLSALTPS